MCCVTARGHYRRGRGRDHTIIRSGLCQLYTKDRFHGAFVLPKIGQTFDYRDCEKIEVSGILSKVTIR